MLLNPMAFAAPTELLRIVVVVPATMMLNIAPTELVGFGNTKIFVCAAAADAWVTRMLLVSPTVRKMFVPLFAITYNNQFPSLASSG